eukprot:SAG31_NODE_28133_length_415_cov_0.648734_1_plen_42_part_01
MLRTLLPLRMLLTLLTLRMILESGTHMLSCTHPQQRPLIFRR